MPREPVQVLEEELELPCRQRLVMSLVAHSLTVRATAGGRGEGCFVRLTPCVDTSSLVVVHGTCRVCRRLFAPQRASSVRG